MLGRIEGENKGGKSDKRLGGGEERVLCVKGVEAEGGGKIEGGRGAEGRK